MLSASANLFWWVEPPYLISLLLYQHTFLCLLSLFDCSTSNTLDAFRSAVLFIINTLLHICADICPRVRTDRLTEWCLHSNHFPRRCWIYLEKRRNTGSTIEVITTSHTQSVDLKWVRLCVRPSISRRPSIGLMGEEETHVARASCQRQKQHFACCRVCAACVCAESRNLFSSAHVSDAFQHTNPIIGPRRQKRHKRNKTAAPALSFYARGVRAWDNIYAECLPFFSWSGFQTRFCFKCAAKLIRQVTFFLANA